MNWFLFSLPNSLSHNHPFIGRTSIRLLTSTVVSFLSLPLSEKLGFCEPIHGTATSESRLKWLVHLWNGINERFIPLSANEIWQLVVCFFRCFVGRILILFSFMRSPVHFVNKSLVCVFVQVILFMLAKYLLTNSTKLLMSAFITNVR